MGRSGREDYDVAVVGGSIAGCTAATFFARRGARVVVLEKATGQDHYKVICSHYIQPSAVPTLERLGVLDELVERGATRNGHDMWSRFGWIRYPREGEATSGGSRPVSIRRQQLDPVLRARALSTPGVDYLAGHVVTDLIAADGRVTGVVSRSSQGGERPIRAKLVVGADGRDASSARLAGVPARLRTNDRFAYMAYYEDLEIARPDFPKMWFLDPDMAYTFPNEDRLTLVAAFPRRDKLPAFRSDPEGAFRRYMEGLPDEAPRLQGGKRVGKLLGRLDMTNRYRPPAARGMAFVGDAALAADPVFGVGCGFALQSAEWLVEEVGDAVVDGDDAGLDAALHRYRRRHRRWFAPHHLLMSDFSAARSLTPIEQLILAGAAQDPEVARRMRRPSERVGSAWEMLAPGLLARAARAAVERRREAAGA